MRKGTFKDVCKRMGGKYESEIGMLPPDGKRGRLLFPWEAKKEWCIFKGMGGVGDGELVVFQGTAIDAKKPEAMSVKIYDKDGYDLLDSDMDGDFETIFYLDQQTMIFKSKNKGIAIWTHPYSIYGKPPNGITLMIEPVDQFEFRATLSRLRRGPIKK